eukprot:scaffold657_cov455-Pavlova_lutheri.AAC.1
MAFLGLCQFYMRFVPHYAELTASLTELNQASMKHGFTSYWKGPQEEAYNKLVAALTNPPVLALFDEDRPIRVETDASDIGMGAKLNQAQQNYHPAEKETCAILYALQHWRHLLFGQHFSVLTDNKASHFLNTKSTEQLSPREIPGSENTGADYLSRHSAKVDSGSVYCILDLCAGMGTT